jgi:hypothetical protein
VRVPDDGRHRELSAAQCVLYRVGIHHELGDVDVALAYAAELEPAALPTPERRPVPRPTPPVRSSTPVTRPVTSPSFESAAPLEVRRPSVRALTARVAEHRPGLPGLAEYVRRTVAVVH